MLLCLWLSLHSPLGHHCHLPWTLSPEYNAHHCCWRVFQHHCHQDSHHWQIYIDPFASTRYTTYPEMHCLVSVSFAQLESDLPLMQKANLQNPSHFLVCFSTSPAFPEHSTYLMQLYIASNILEYPRIMCLVRSLTACAMSGLEYCIWHINFPMPNLSVDWYSWDRTWKLQNCSWCCWCVVASIPKLELIFVALHQHSLY